MPLYKHFLYVSTLHVPVIRMLGMDTVHRVNNYVSFIVGSTLNATVLWLVAKKSSKELRLYSRILLQTAVVDLVFLATTFLYSPVILIGNGRAVMYGVGPLSLEPADASSAAVAAVRQWNLGAYTIWAYTLFFIQYSIAVPFIHRYFTLCHERVLPLYVYTVMLTVVGLVCAASVPMTIYADCSNSGELGEVERRDAAEIFFGVSRSKQSGSLWR